MLINARSPDWNLLMGPIWWRTGYLISSKCCNSNNKNTFQMHHVRATIVTLAHTLTAVQLRNILHFQSFLIVCLLKDVTSKRHFL